MNIQPIGIQPECRNSKNKTSFGSKDSVLDFGLDTLKNQIKLVHDKRISDCRGCPNFKNIDLGNVAERLFNELSALHQRFLKEPAADIFIRMDEYPTLGPADEVRIDLMPSSELYTKYKAKFYDTPSRHTAPDETARIPLNKCWGGIKDQLELSIGFLDRQAQTNTKTFNSL